jgi:uncharacterized protein
MSNGLIIFVRNPELGKVKTRLASTLGDVKALAIYQELLLHTKLIAEKVVAEKGIFYADYINPNDIWDGYQKCLQRGNDLGKRMENAFDALFDIGFKKICIIGSDCYDITSDIINEAFEKLDTYEVVVGPATDGGYYLLGMQAPIKNIFDNIKWSSDQVFEQTKNIIEAEGFTYTLLPMVNDIDEESDLPLILKKIIE